MMTGETKARRQDVISDMFFYAAIVMIFVQMVGVVAQIIDGVITSKVLGSDAYSAISLLVPLTNAMLLLANFVSTGSQIQCSNLIGAGKRREANGIFAFSILAGLLISAFFVIACIFFPDVLFRICGVSVNKNPELYPYMRSYLNGYLFGVPAMLLIQIISPMIVMDNGKRLVSISAAVLCVGDIIGDLLNAYVFHGGNFGMGLATSIAFNLQLLVLLTHYLRGAGRVSLSLKDFQRRYISEIARDGLPTFIRKLATILRDLLINRINLWVALSTAAIAARGMQNDLNTLMFCVGLGIGKTLVTMTGMYYGANDLQGLKRLFSYAMKFAVVLSGAVSVVMFLCAPMIARFYTDDPEVITLSVFSLRCMAVSFVFDTVSVSFQDYLQGVKNRKLVTFLNFTERFFLPVLMALVLGLLFGSMGIMASIAVSKIVLVLMMFGIICFRCRALPRKWEDFMFLPKDFGGKQEDNLYAQIQTIDDVIKESQRTEEFCLSHGVQPDRAKLMGLFVEEMAGNIVLHGNKKGRKGVCADFRLSLSEGKLCLSLRDFCMEFDPFTYYELHKDEGPGENIGLRIVTELAGETAYINAFNSNNILIYL